MRFAITGGLGYIGQVLQEELKKAGHEFTVIDNDMMGLHNWENKLNILNPEDLIEIRDIIRNSDAVVNLAAYKIGHGNKLPRNTKYCKNM